MREYLCDLLKHEPEFNWYRVRRTRNEDMVTYAYRICQQRDIYWKKKIEEVIQEVEKNELGRI